MASDSSFDIGYITGAVLGSVLYDMLGYEGAYRGVSLTLIVMAFVTSKFLMKHLITKKRIDQEQDLLDLEDQSQLLTPSRNNAQTGHCNDNSSRERNDITTQYDEMEIGTLQMEAQEDQNKCSNSNPTTLSIVNHPRILCAAMSILWISASWCFLEPILAKRLLQFDLGKRQIGFMFALSNIVYVPTAFFIQYIPSKYIDKHTTVAISILLTPIGVLLVGANSLPLMTLGILLLGLFPTPVWIYLLPSMQEDASILFTDGTNKRRVNDVTAGIYNMFITLGQIVGYIIGPLVNKTYGVTTTTRIVAGFIFMQLFVYCFGVGMCSKRSSWQRKGRRRGRYFARYIL